MPDTHPSPDVVGQEGLATTVAAVAQQVSAVEKSTSQQFAAISSATATAEESTRRERSLEASRIDVLLSENRAQSTLLTEGLRAETNLMIAGVMRDLNDYKAASLAHGVTLISKYDGVITAQAEALRMEMQAIASVAGERMVRFMEVKELHWAEHNRTHAKESEAIHTASNALDRRLTDMNHLNARIESLTREFPTKESIDQRLNGIEARIERNEVDARLRDERKEGKLYELEKNFGIELRKEVRPVQDSRVSQAAVIAAVFGAVTLIIFAVAMFNFLGSLKTVH